MAAADSHKSASETLADLVKTTPGDSLFVRHWFSGNVVYSSKSHVVWCPKYRRKVLAGSVEKRLRELIHKAAARYRAEVTLEIMPDQVHLLVEVDPQFGIHRLVKHSKGVTSHELRKEFDSLRTRLPSLWTNSCFCSTVGGAPLIIC